MAAVLIVGGMATFNYMGYEEQANLGLANANPDAPGVVAYVTIGVLEGIIIAIVVCGFLSLFISINSYLKEMTEMLRPNGTPRQPLPNIPPALPPTPVKNGGGAGHWWNV